MNDNPIKQLRTLGQSVWLDYISRELLTSGELGIMLDRDGLMGMTSNPTIFENAIAKSSDYDREIMQMAEDGMDTMAIYEALSQKDVQSAADQFRTVYDQTNGKDGYVSLEVNPHLAYDTEGTIEEGRRLFSALDRPNIMIKVPATKQGLAAIETLTAEGININVTLIFDLPRYKEVVQSYMAGLEKRVNRGEPIDTVHSVASFFISRIDTAVDAKLLKIIDQGGDAAKKAEKALGQVAIASAKAAVLIQDELFASDCFKALRDKGANVQRLLWASTSTKDPKYSDVIYVEELIGTNTVNTIPTSTLDLYRDHGQPALRLGNGLEEAKRILESLKELGIDLKEVTQKLEDEGVDKFNVSFDSLIDALDRKTAAGA